ncbi:hypothetical protein [Methanolobus profundi]|uniref:Uncharacterized protein n=1 Tax=Methanolobus profundi TaxID=487685 RepID=A0A1I4Q1T8_9EURY|nr:hypothetical protein [Methanolobus profundi]SFM34048.1 hypothetical protein SAMN04488696_1047 [Methanolobus profundi]
MSTRSLFLVLICMQLCFVVTASGDAIFSNDIVISEDTVTFVIDETYSGVDSEEFRATLDLNADRSVNSSEVNNFASIFEDSGKYRYLGYIFIDDNEVVMSIDSFDIEFIGVEGNVNTSELSVSSSIVYDLDAPLSKGDHNVWILGHPSITSMQIRLPEGALLSSYDGIESSSVYSEDNRVVIEGASGIRSFISDGRPTYEYAVSIDFKTSSFVADMSIFNNFFSTSQLL